jgi:hypothetical protein
VVVGTNANEVVRLFPLPLLSKEGRRASIFHTIRRGAGEVKAAETCGPLLRWYSKLMPDKPMTDLEIETKRRTVAKIYLVLSLGMIAGVAVAWMYLFSGPTGQ